MTQFKQDMPPLGGYAPITYQRVPLKPGLSAKVKLLILLGISGASFAHLAFVAKKQINNERLEMRCSRLALAPMIHAENDRATLKQLKKNRDDEEKIMKDVPDWEVGKWKGNPVYLTFDPDKYFIPHPAEYYAHLSDKDITNIVCVRKIN